MMRSTIGKTLLTLFLMLVMGFVLLGLLIWLTGPMVMPLLLFLTLIYGWVLYAFLQYRLSRQDEFLFMMAGAAEAGTPLTPALRAYLADRPQGGLKSFWTGLALFMILPGYYWLWHKKRSFDHRLERVTSSLEMGIPIKDALLTERGVASPSTLLAISVGESSGRMSQSLMESRDGELASIWMDTLPRILYPLGLLLAINGILAFWSIYLLPRFLRMFQEFGFDFPLPTKILASISHVLSAYSPLLFLLTILFFIGCGFAFFSPEVRWRIPVINVIYKKALHSRIMKMLSVLFQSGKTVPDALRILAESAAFPRPLLRRLKKGKMLAEEGIALPDVLQSVGVLPRSMVPLVRAAQRADNIPWAMRELG
ncbi:MAG: type II secretion system F family protein, partial [Gemmataceae bacterium]